MRWQAPVRVHGARGTLLLEGMALGRTTMLVRGDVRRYDGEEITVELELEGHRIFVVALVQAARWDDQAVLRFGVTSPLGNDLLARHARGHVTDRGSVPIHRV